MVASAAEMLGAAVFRKELAIVWHSIFFVKCGGKIHRTVVAKRNCAAMPKHAPMRIHLRARREHLEPFFYKLDISVGHQTEHRVDKLGLVIHRVKYLAAPKKLADVERSLKIGVVDLNVLFDLKYLDGVEINCHPLYEGTHLSVFKKIAEDTNKLLSAQ